MMRDSSAECIPLIRDSDDCSGRCTRLRVVIAVWTFLALLISFTNRFNLSVVVVAMVNKTYVKEHDTKNQNSSIDACPMLAPINKTKVWDDGEFDWTQETQGIVSSAFFYGYILTQFPGGYLSDKYGAKHVVGFSVLFSSAFALLQPIAAKTNLYFFIALRVLLGIFQGFVFTSSTSLMASWAPYNERTVMNMSPSAGIAVGTIVAFGVSGILCETAVGWPLVFYVFGALGVAWYPSWLYLISSTPRDHPRISQSELDYIETSQLSAVPIVMDAVPWFEMLTSLPIWSLVLGSAGLSFGNVVILAFLPTYLEEVLKFPLTASSVLSVLPYLTVFIGTAASSFFADILNKRLKHVSFTRKFMTFLSNIVSGVCLVCIPLVGCNRIAVVALLCLTTFFASFQVAGIAVNVIDVAPQYAGIIIGIANTVGCGAMILAPFVAGYLTDTAQSLDAWSKVFYVMAGVSGSTGLIYLIFGSGNEQKWARRKHTLIVNDHIVENSNSNDSIS